MEHIPADWGKIDVALYHVYHDNFNLSDTKIEVRIVPQEKLANYCLILQVQAHGNEDKRGWSFEGIGITQHK